MWDIIKENKYSVGFLAVILLGVIAYSIFLVFSSEAGPAGQDGSGGISEEVAGQQIGAEVFQEVRRLESISFDGQVFEEPAYQSLVRFGYSPEPKVQGRNNPFAPIGPSTGRELISE